jgi:hypothetical protein
MCRSGHDTQIGSPAGALITQGFSRFFSGSSYFARVILARKNPIPGKPRPCGNGAATALWQALQRHTAIWRKLARALRGPSILTARKETT